MDRLDAMKVFVAALDEGSLASAGRRLGRSPAAVSRSIAFLEHHVGAELLHRTTRALKLSEVGVRYAEACRRVLAELDEADSLVAGQVAAPRGTLAITAPIITGEEILQPILDEYLDAFPAVAVKLFLWDRNVNLIDEGLDLAVRVGNLPDSSFIAFKLGEVRRVIAASPRYLASQPKIEEPADLAKHQVVTQAVMGVDSWTFPPAEGSTVPRTVQFNPRLLVNNVRSALTAALHGHGVTRLFSYHVAEAVRDKKLEIVLSHAEAPPIPIHLVTPQGRAAVPKVRSFIDFALPRLRDYFARQARIFEGK